MSREQPFREELELDEVLARQQQLQKRLLEYERSRREMERNQAERESMIPPLDEIHEREKWRRHAELVSRGEIANVRRDQNHGLLLLLLLLAATGSLVWWGLSLMQGG